MNSDTKKSSALSAIFLNLVNKILSLWKIIIKILAKYFSKKTFARQLISIKGFLFGVGWYRTRQVERDLLDREHHSANISKKLYKNFLDSEDSYVFAISGKWGEGKTDLLNRIEPKLLEKNVAVVWFRPWQYTEDSETLRRVFLKVLSKNLQSYRNLFKKIRFNILCIGLLDRLKYSEAKTSVNLRFLIWAIPIILLAISLISIYQILNIGKIDHIIFLNYFVDVARNQPLIAATLAFFGLGSLFLELIRIHKTQSKVTSIDEFEELFSKTIWGFEKIVIFIDDLDRCTPEAVKTVLDSLKTFFKNEKVNYVVTGDHTVLERYIGKQLNVRSVYKTDGDGDIDKKRTEFDEELEGKRFLKKLFNVYWRLPLPDYVYIKKLVRNKLNEISALDDDTKNTIETFMVNFLEKNPREIRRFVEILQFSLKTIETRLKDVSEEQADLKRNLEEVTNNKSLLAKVLLIQEKFDTEFKKFAEQPSRYAKLEYEQLKNRNGEESSGVQADLSEQSAIFFNIVKTKPTFHNNRLVLENSPDAFFYYSGFAGSSEIGVLSEDFLQRYITSDQNLKDDLKGTTESRIKEILGSAISNLGQLKEAGNIIHAINNLMSIFTSDIPVSWESIIDFLDDNKVKEHFNSSPDDEKNKFVTNLSLVVTKSNNLKLLNKTLSEEPWLTKKDIFLQSIDTGKTTDNFLDEITKDLLKDQQNSIDISSKKQKILNEHLQLLNNAENENIEVIKNTIQRLNLLSEKLELDNLTNNQIFGQIVQKIKTLSDKPKRDLLLDFIKKGNKLWSKCAITYNDLRLLKQKTKLRKTDSSVKVREVYESWYPKRTKKRKKKRS